MKIKAISRLEKPWWGVRVNEVNERIKEERDYGRDWSVELIHEPPNGQRTLRSVPSDMFKEKIKCKHVSSAGTYEFGEGDFREVQAIKVDAIGRPI